MSQPKYLDLPQCLNCHAFACCLLREEREGGDELGEWGGTHDVLRCALCGVPRPGTRAEMAQAKAAAESWAKDRPATVTCRLPAYLLVRAHHEREKLKRLQEGRW